MLSGLRVYKYFKQCSNLKIQPVKQTLVKLQESMDMRIMGQLNGDAHLMIVSDLDFTMVDLSACNVSVSSSVDPKCTIPFQVDHDDPEDLSLLRFNALWEAYYRNNSLLVYSSGRSPVSCNRLRSRKPLLTPDITITSVGTEIMYGESMVRDYEWEQYLSQKWDRAIVTEETAKFPELTLQHEEEQRPHKVSFFVEKSEATDIIGELSRCLEKRGIDVKIIFSRGKALDVLPRGAGKGEALAYLLNKFRTGGSMPNNTLVCGDSGNDADLFSIPSVYGVIVSNAHEELLQWYAENAKKNPRIIHATERCAAGIIQAIGKFGLGPNVSPRDIRDFEKCKVDLFTPGHEVVRLYLLFERWRRAEVDRSDPFIGHLRLIFKNSLGILVHPSGKEKSFSQCIDEITESYGDMQGKQFRIWIDQVSASQIGSDTWLVRFNKWESSDVERRCCLTTALLSSKNEKSPDLFSWIHVHQTWTHGSATGDPRTWLF